MGKGMGPQQIIAASSRTDAFVELTQDTHHMEAEDEVFDGDTWSSRSESTSSVVQSTNAGIRVQADILLAGPGELAVVRFRDIRRTNLSLVVDWFIGVTCA